MISPAAPPPTTSPRQTTGASPWITRTLATLLLVYWLVLITATHIPRVPEPLGFRPSDKLLHLAAYAVFAALAAVVCWLHWGFTWRTALVLLVAISLHGAIDEVTQPLVGRYADVVDWYADTLGAAAALAVATIAAHLVLRSRNPGHG